MALRDAETPDAAELTELAEPTAEDARRAVGIWNRTSGLPGLLAAERDDDAGDADAPIADDET